MMRDMDLIRSLLDGIASDSRLNRDVTLQPGIGDFGITAENHQAVTFHLNLMLKAGLIEGVETAQMPMVRNLTWRGYDFLESVRSPQVWQMTKDAAKEVGGVAFDVLLGIAKAYGKQLLQEKLGFRID